MLAKYFTIKLYRTPSFTYDSHGNLLEGSLDGQPFTCTYDGKGGMVFQGSSVDWPDFRLQFRSYQVTPELKQRLDELGATYLEKLL